MLLIAVLIVSFIPYGALFLWLRKLHGDDPAYRKLCGKVETVDQYIEEQDEKVRPYLNEVRQIIRNAIPGAQEKISWSMPTYWKGQNLIHFAASKKHLGLYPGGEATTVFAEKLAGFDVSKGTIRLPYTKPLPKDLIAEIAVWCYGQYAK